MWNRGKEDKADNPIISFSEESKTCNAKATCWSPGKETMEEDRNTDEDAMIGQPRNQSWRGGAVKGDHILFP